MRSAHGAEGQRLTLVRAAAHARVSGNAREEHREGVRRGHGLGGARRLRDGAPHASTPVSPDACDSPLPARTNRYLHGKHPGGPGARAAPRTPRGAHLLVSRLVGDGESQSEPRVLVNGAAAVFAAHPTYGSESCGTWRAQHVRRGRGKEGASHTHGRGSSEGGACPPRTAALPRAGAFTPHLPLVTRDAGNPRATTGSPVREKGVCLFSLRECHPGSARGVGCNRVSEQGPSPRVGEEACLSPQSSVLSRAWVEHSCEEGARQGS